MCLEDQPTTRTVMSKNPFDEYPGLRFYWNDITAAAKAHRLDPYLVAAVVVKESSANTDAYRFEPLFWNRYLKRLPDWMNENPRRASASYGLMQVMYPVAVERGLARTVPPESLFQPVIGLEYGCRQLVYMMDKIDTKWPQEPGESRLRAALASYNGGLQGPNALRPDNRSYADRVLAIYAAFPQSYL